MSLKALKTINSILAILIIIATLVLICVLTFNKTVELPNDKFEVGQYTISYGETVWDFWSENIGSKNCSWEKYRSAVRSLNGDISLGDLRANQTIYVYYLIESEVN